MMNLSLCGSALCPTVAMPESPVLQSYEVDIGTLFLTGFATSGVCSMFVGPYIDQYGRKLACVLYCVLEIVINLLEHSSDFKLLLVGRVLGGLSTALLFTALESWMITEHRKRKFAEELLADTFSRAAAGNGVVAVLAGVIAQVMADRFGEIGPFQAAIALTVVALAAICATWDENYGSTNQSSSHTKGASALQVIKQDRRVLLVGLVQSLFEGAMYTFVFNWVPTLIALFPKQHSFGQVQGLIFSCFMVCMSIGGSSFSLLQRATSVQRFSVPILALAAGSMLVPVTSTQLPVVMAAFFVMEACVGVLGACVGTMRSMVVPERISASVMNLFRVPLNVLVVVGTKLDSYAAPSTVFLVCFSWLAMAALLQLKLSAVLHAKQN
eukprot:TRINITY_DN8932_c0_g1_i4.p1 TRINITY_DN8932_c0_g1~~TRINITY_DN8932_c0_g1_i4.p1  ORF type:complete len:383 (-),score=106.51 TRINITY_DN8932_c0_g1_i4:38-1186(-)